MRDAQIPRVIDVFPGGSIQRALEAAVGQPGKRIIRVHAGTYRPSTAGQALIYLNARHEGIALEAVGDVVLTAANLDIADPRTPGYPAIVNHVVYFGDGLSPATSFRGFKITGANGFVSGPPDLLTIRTTDDLMKSITYRTLAPSPIESNNSLIKTQYFYTDGGGILVHGRSYPSIESVEVYDNAVSVCGGGVSVQHVPGAPSGAVLFKNCVFRDNRASFSGSAVDILTPGSWAILENCLFTGNLSNDGNEAIAWPGHGALTVFPGGRATVTRCTFTGNRNAVDDWGSGSSYRNTIFWQNDRPRSSGSNVRFELFVRSKEEVTDCIISDIVGDVLGTISRATNKFSVLKPSFDAEYRPLDRAYDGVGYRPSVPNGP